MNRVNLRRFDFDYDVTWNAFFLDEKLNVYSRYGGRDDGDPERRLSKEGLQETMRSVLAAHRQAKADPENAEKLYQPVPKDVFQPEDIPLLKQNHQGCVHCHQVREYQLLQWAHDGEFSREKLFAWPLPENVGLTLEFKHGRRVTAVARESAGAKAGIRPGDELLRMNSVPVRSEYDIRWMLHRAETGKPMAVELERRSTTDPSVRETVQVQLELQGDWRATEIGWRKSMRSVPLEFGFRGYSLSRSQRKELMLTEEQLAIRITAIRPKGLAKALGLQKLDVIVAHGDDTKDRAIEQFLSDLLRRHSPGSEVRLTVLRDGARVQLQGPFPEWHTDETTVP